jgi:glucan biosynthesis protein C
LFSLISIPLLIFLRSPRSIGFKQLLLNFLSRPVGILFIPTFVIAITQFLLRPFFPEETHALIDDWAFFTFYFCFFLLGSICYSSRELWESVGNNRRHLLTAAIFILIPFYAFYFHLLDLITLPWTDEQVEISFDVTAVFVSWFWVITVIAFGQHYLNRYRPWLAKLNEGLYPFYILHQTAIITIGYYVCQLDWGIAAKFWTVSILTLIISIVVYLILIRPFNWMRFLFGVRLKGQSNRAIISIGEAKMG